MKQFENEFVKVELINDSTALLITWSGFIPSEKYRDALTRSLEIAKKYKIKNWVSDIKAMKVIAMADQEWASTEWLVKAVTGGCYHKQAVIMADDIFGQASAKKILATVANQEIEIQNFNNIQDAKAWLQE
jgi:hypothetical protein